MNTKTKTCCKCGKSFSYMPENARWMEYGTYSQKVVDCPHCGCVNVVKYQDGFNQNPNLDERYFG